MGTIYTPPHLNIFMAGQFGKKIFWESTIIGSGRNTDLKQITGSNGIEHSH